MINLIQPLPFFDRLTEQVFYKENCDGIYKFLSQPDTLIPFQIKVDPSAAVIDYISIIGLTCRKDIDLVENAGKFNFHAADGKKWLVYKGDQLTFVRVGGGTEPLTLPRDYFYFEISIDGVVKYSEIFHVPGDGICDMPINLIIEAWHPKNMNGYTFDNGFKFKCYFNSFVTDMVAEVTDEFLKDGYERKVLSRRVIQFTHNIELEPLPHTVAIGLVAITAFKNITITDNNNQYEVKDITVKTEKIEGGALYSVLLSFSVFNQDIVRTNC